MTTIPYFKVVETTEAKMDIGLYRFVRNTKPANIYLLKVNNKKLENFAYVPNA